MLYLRKIRENFFSRWSWWLLLLTFALTFLLSDRGDARNYYRVLVVLPVFLMLSGPELKGFFAHKPMRWFAAVSLYFSVTLLWGVEASFLDNYLLRILSVWGFAVLIFSVARFRPELFAQIDKFLVLFGLVWVVLLIFDWDSLWQANPSFNRKEIGRGVFSHHLQVGWMLAVLTLLSLQRVFLQNSKRYIWIVITIFFIVVLVLGQARGGMVIFFTGVMVLFLTHSRHLNWRLILTAGVGLLCAIWGGYLFSPEFLNGLVARADAGRFIIWQNWFSVWSESVVNMIFGYGLGAPTENMILNFTAVHFHNLYLSTMYYGGLFGLFLTIGWFISLAKIVNKEKRFNSPWIPVSVGMLAGFLTDGDKLFNYPGAFVFCFLLPMFCLTFDSEIRGK